MAERADQPRFLREAAHALRVLSEARGQQFQRHAAAQIQILGQIDFSHAARAELRKNAVMRNRLRNHDAKNSNGGLVGAMNDA